MGVLPDDALCKALIPSTQGVIEESSEIAYNVPEVLDLPWPASCFGSSWPAAYS